MQSGFPARLRALRKQRGLTQHALAREVGVTKASICHWEAGRAQPRRRSLVRLAKALGVTSTYLIKDVQSRVKSEEKFASDSLGAVIGEAKNVIAAVAGTEPAKVTILLNY